MYVSLKINLIPHKDITLISTGIKVSCRNKIILYVSCRGSNDSNLELRYKRYCKILTDVIKTAKKQYDELMSNSKNK